MIRYTKKNGDIFVDCTLKYALIGDEGVGKTTLFQLFLSGKLNLDSTSTIGASFGSKILEMPNENLKLRCQIWDTAGQERYKSLVPMYFRGSNIIFIVFDLNDRKSWESVKFWHQQIECSSDRTHKCVLIGTKADKKINVDASEISSLCRELDLDYHQISAIDPLAYRNIYKIFKNTAYECYVQRKPDKLPSDDDISSDDEQNTFNFNLTARLKDTQCCVLF